MTRAAVVNPDSGAVETVDAKDLGAAVESGFRPATGDEIKKQRIENTYGGIGGAASAAVLGVARGVVPGFDPLMVEGTRLFAGDQTANDVREKLAGYQEANPIASGVGEVGGALVGLGKMGSLARVATAAGEAAAGARATSALARIGQAAVKTGVEGAIYGANQGLSDVTLHPELDSTHILTSAAMGGGFGALLGGASRAVAVEAPLAAYGAVKKGVGKVASVIGEAVAPTVEAAGNVAGKLDSFLPDSDTLQKWSNENAWRATYARKKFTDEIEARVPGGTAEAGRILKQTKVVDTDAGVLANALSLEELLGRLEAAEQRVGAARGALTENSKATVKVGDILQSIEQEIAPLRKIAGRENTVASLEAYKTSLLGKLDAYSPKGRILIGKEVTLQDLAMQRKGLQDIVFGEVKSLDPVQRVESLRAIRNSMNDLEIGALAKEGIDEKAVRELNKQYQVLRIAREATEDAVSRGSANRSLGATDYLAYIGGGGGITGATAALINKVARERGSAAASVFLEDLAKTRSIRDSLSKVAGSVPQIAEQVGATEGAARVMATVARVSDAARKEYGEALRSFVSGAKKVGTAAMQAREVTYLKGFSTAEAYWQMRKRTEEYAAAPEMLEDRLREQYAPLFTASPVLGMQLAMTAKRGADYILQTMPNDGPPVPSLTPYAKRPRDSRLRPDQQQWLRTIRAVELGPRAIVQELKQGNLSRETVKAVKAVHPEAWARMRDDVLDVVSERAQGLPYNKLVQLSALLDAPTDPTLTPAFISSVQQAYGPSGETPEAPQRQKATLTPRATTPGEEIES